MEPFSKGVDKRAPWLAGCIARDFAPFKAFVGKERKYFTCVIYTKT